MMDIPEVPILANTTNMNLCQSNPFTVSFRFSIAAAIAMAFVLVPGSESVGQIWVKNNTKGAASPDLDRIPVHVVGHKTFKSKEVSNPQDFIPFKLLGGTAQPKPTNENQETEKQKAAQTDEKAKPEEEAAAPCKPCNPDPLADKTFYGLDNTGPTVDMSFSPGCAPAYAQTPACTPQLAPTVAPSCGGCNSCKDCEARKRMGPLKRRYEARQADPTDWQSYCDSDSCRTRPMQRIKQRRATAGNRCSGKCGGSCDGNSSECGGSIAQAMPMPLPNGNCNGNCGGNCDGSSSDCGGRRIRQGRVGQGRISQGNRLADRRCGENCGGDCGSPECGGGRIGQGRIGQGKITRGKNGQGRRLAGKRRGGCDSNCNGGCSDCGGGHFAQGWTSPLGHPSDPGNLDFMMKARTASDVSIDKPKPSHAHVNWEAYRNCEKYPIDPRKPCNDCVRPAQIRGSKIKTVGYLGRPHMDDEPGGCDCGKRKCKQCRLRKNMVSLTWPRPFSAKFDEKNPARAAKRYQPCQKPKLIDMFDRLENFKVVNYVRRDDGHRGDRWGRNKDPFGCLGESRQAARVFGVDFRSPGDPVSPGNVIFESAVTPYANMAPDMTMQGYPMEYTVEYPMTGGYPAIERTAVNFD